MILFDIFAKEIVIIMEKQIKQCYEVPEAIILLIEPELLIALSEADWKWFNSSSSSQRVMSTFILKVNS
jgi:hypothetical protein